MLRAQSLEAEDKECEYYVARAPEQKLFRAPEDKFFQIRAPEDEFGEIVFVETEDEKAALQEIVKYLDTFNFFKFKDYMSQTDLKCFLIISVNNF